MFLVLAVVLSMLFIYTSFTRSQIPTQCAGFGGISCNMAYLYSNSTYNYSLLTLVLVDSQPAPINITSVAASLGTLAGKGFCNPQKVDPGQETVCGILFSYTLPEYSLVHGAYSANAVLCSSGIKSLSGGACGGSAVRYSGSLFATAKPAPEYIWVAQAAVGPPSNQIPSYSAYPLIPSQYIITANGEWNAPGGRYAFCTYEAASNPACHYGTMVNGVPTSLFPPDVNRLNAFVNESGGGCSGSCHPPTNVIYNTTFSLAYTIYYLRSPERAAFNIFADDGMEVYYKPYSSTAWSPLFGSSVWYSADGNSYTSAPQSMSGGFYDVATAWYNGAGYGIELYNSTIV
jgi:hypothetical protein